MHMVASDQIGPNYLTALEDGSPVRLGLYVATVEQNNAPAPALFIKLVGKPPENSSATLRFNDLIQDCAARGVTRATDAGRSQLVLTGDVRAALNIVAGHLCQRRGVEEMLTRYLPVWQEALEHRTKREAHLEELRKKRPYVETEISVMRNGPPPVVWTLGEPVKIELSRLPETAIVSPARQRHTLIRPEAGVSAVPA